MPKVYLQNVFLVTPMKMNKFQILYWYFFQEVVNIVCLNSSWFVFPHSFSSFLINLSCKVDWGLSLLQAKWLIRPEFILVSVA